MRPDEIRERVAEMLWVENHDSRGLTPSVHWHEMAADAPARVRFWALADAVLAVLAVLDRDALLSMLGAEQAAWETAYGLYGIEADEATLRRRPRGDETTPLYRLAPSEER